MAVCGGCGAPIMWGEHVDTGELVPLEPRAELGPGESRFVIVDHAGHRRMNHRIAPVSASSTAEAYADHRRDCPDHGDGHP